MTYTLWPWQDDGAAFCEPLPASVLNGGMGTGKSLTIIDLIRRWGCKRVLIIGPLATVSENAWGSEWRDYAPDARVLLLAKGTVAAKTEHAGANLRVAEAYGDVCINIVNYESLWREPFAKHALTAGYDCVIVDESHRAKSPKGRASKYLGKLCGVIKSKGGRVVLLTGTLMPHSPLDVWAQYRMVDPEIFGRSFFRFKMRYAVLGGFENRQVLRFQNMDELRAKIAPYTFQVSADVLQFDAPLVSTIHVDLAPDVKRAYDSMEANLVAEIGDGLVTAANGLVKLLRLQQFTSGFTKLDEAKEATRVGDSKLDALVEILEGTMEEPVVVFGRFTGDQISTMEASAKTGRWHFELSGHAKQLDDWGRVCRAPRAPDVPAPVLGVQIGSGGTGIDLTAAGIAVYMSTGFDMGQFDQSMARLNRPGRKPVVRFIHVVAEGTIDERVSKALASRRNLVESVLHDLRAAETV